MATSSQTEEHTFSAERYFATQPPPTTLESDVARVSEFIQRQQREGRKVVLVTVRALGLRDLGIDVDPRFPNPAERRDHRPPRAQCVSTVPKAHFQDERS